MTTQDNKRTYKTYEEIIEERSSLSQLASFLISGTMLNESEYSSMAEQSLDDREERANEELEKELSKIVNERYILDDNEMLKKLMNVIQCYSIELQFVNTEIGMKYGYKIEKSLKG